MDKINTDLISCIRAALYGQAIDCDVAKCIPAAYAHGVINLLYYAAMKLPVGNRPNSEVLSMLKHRAYAGVLRETLQSKVLEELYRRFESSQIRCVALKGAVLKELYPKPELRHMSDIDILIDAAKASEVRKHFEEMGCEVLKFDIQGNTDQYLTREGLNFEIKKTLSNESFNMQTHKFTQDLLLYARPLPGYDYICRLPNEEHYAYILCHIVKHLIDGGVGVRPIMDVWICKNKMEMDRPKLSRLLKKLKLEKFAENVEHLASVWFGEAEETPLDTELGRYILGSGAFGTQEQRVTDRILTKTSNKSVVKYIFRRVFPPFRAMRNYFPVLQKIPVLLPFYWIWRIIYAGIFRRKKLSNEIRTVTDIDAEKLQNKAEFYKRCGINI